VSIAALFTGGMLPAAVLALALAVRRLFPLRQRLSSWCAARHDAGSGRAFVIAIPALILPVLIRAAVV
jgi:TRAP-type C4-dicarboxylate transport system permease large subunit